MIGCRTLGVTTVQATLKQLFDIMDIGHMVEIQVFAKQSDDKVHIRVWGPFKLPEDFVDDAWERNEI